MIAAVLFDLDDTLYDQDQWLAGAWRAVAVRAADWGVDADTLESALHAVAAGGSDRGGIIDAALVRTDATHVPVPALVHAFRSYAPTRLDPYPGIPVALARLRNRLSLALVSDGDPATQANKLAALRIRHSFDAVVWSDEYGRAHRKPDPLPFSVALDAVGVDAANAVYIGDRPAKDVAGPVGVGMRAVRVRTGEWSGTPDDPRSWASVPTAVDAMALVEHELNSMVRRPA